MKATPDLILKDIDDKYIRENFFRLQSFLDKVPFFKGDFKFFEFVFDRPVTMQKLAHGLGFKPTDVIQTSIIGPATLTWNYENFDSTNLVVTTSGACKVRVFIGAYREDK